MSDSKLIDFYISLLKFCGLSTDAEGYISYQTGEKSEPSYLDGVRLALPYPNQLRSPKPSERVIFHPLNENIIKGESRVLSCLRNIINVRFNYTVGVIGLKLLELATSQDLHKKLNPSQTELLIKLGEVHKDAPQAFLSLMMSGIDTSAGKLFTNIYLTKGAVVNKRTFARAGIVSFPFYEQLVKGDKTQFLSKTTKRDDATFKSLMEYIFPNIDTPESYNVGSDSDIATWFCALMSTSIKIAARLNDIIELFSNVLVDTEKLLFEAEWIDQFNNLSSIERDINNIPMQAGNEGTNKLEQVIANKLTNHETPQSRLREREANDYNNRSEPLRERERYTSPREIPTDAPKSQEGVPVVSIQDFLRGNTSSQRDNRDIRDSRDYGRRDSRSDRDYRDNRPSYNVPSAFSDPYDNRRETRPQERRPGWDAGGTGRRFGGGGGNYNF